ncbi:MAG: 50S ribosomal protein L7ae [Terrisporobacter othiniensis]|uniref:50S ribosomal protein L7ae n=1 Tax=Terrisporobacter petrolearius TaxID=1460447 RepID=UPI0022E72EC1|nr:50S ribosomal protein L7ae [Terrisporobacter petrolearius]MDU4861622.1 50S ribosomal protein L7ae [Terrisporobacter othiniensis]MDU6995275.1 50S ribosomal protein L7ae [Terrisporobacter othiniensis]
MNKNKYVMIFIVLSMVLVGCSKNYMASIYNDNEKISSDANSFNLDVDKQSIDGQKSKGVIKKIEGMDTIWTYESDKDMELDMTYLLNVVSGKLKLVLISPDSSVTTLIERSKESEVVDYATNTLQIKKGLNRIKIVANKNTSIEFNIIIPNGQFNELGM